MADQVDIKRRGGRWDPDKITEKTLVPKELGDEIVKQIEIHMEQGFDENQAVHFGIDQAIINWRKKRADKSGG